MILIRKTDHVKHMMWLFSICALVILVIAFEGLLLIRARAVTDPVTPIGIFVIAVAVVAVIFAALKFQDESGMYRRGMVGESEVGSVLTELDDRYTVFQGLRIGNKGDIDFVVVGPSGIFTVEAKRYRRVSDEDLAHFRTQANGEMYALKKYIEIYCHINLWVTPIIVFVDQGNRIDMTFRHGLYLATPQTLVHTILSQHENIADQQRADIIAKLKAA